MALIHTRTVAGQRYEIRNAGRSLRLYTNGVLHSQYHPGRIVTGGVWDLLALPAIALPKVKNVLMLGVGGGAAVHLLRAFVQPARIVGVDLNRTHLTLARRYFGLRGPDLELHCQDACQFVADYQGEPFDFIIDDVFGEVDGKPQRGIDADRPWCRSLAALLSPTGALSINTVSPAALRQTAWHSDPQLARQLPGRLKLTLPCYANAVGAFFRQPITPAQLRQAVRADPWRQQQEKRSLLRYRIGGF